MELDFIKWLGHASFLLSINGKMVYLDPFMLAGHEEQADMILITHPHSDHLSPDAIKKIATNKTKVYVPKDSVGKIPLGEVIGVEPNKTYNAEGIKFHTVPAYNHKQERLHFHPKESGWVGYVIDDIKARVYHAGDTDFIEEMKKIDTGLALIPIGGTYVMTVDEAIPAAKAIKAEKVAPIHYRMLLGAEGSKAAEEKFLKGVKNGIVLEEEGEPRYSF